MARKAKQGLDYFPHNCTFDDNLEYLIALHKEVGYYVYFRMLEKIYFEKGYFFEASQRNLILFAGRINVDITVINAIINDCLNEQLFDNEMYANFNILTSNGIQCRFFEAIKRRKEVDLINEYILLIDVDILIKGVTINYLNVDKSTQRREEKRTVNKIKVKREKKEKTPASSSKQKAVVIPEDEVYRKFDHLVLSNIDFEKLKKDYSKDKIDEVLDKIENYKKNSTYKSLFLTAKNWLKSDEIKKEESKVTSFGDKQIVNHPDWKKHMSKH